MFILKKVQDQIMLFFFQKMVKKSSIQFQILLQSYLQISHSKNFTHRSSISISIDISSISDTSDPSESSNSSRKATKSTDLPLKSGLANRSHEEITEYRDLTVSDMHTHSSRDSVLFLFQIILLQGNLFQGSLQGS